MSFNWVTLLDESKGRSEYVIAINIDIRGFTPFSLSVESIDLGQYIKSVYSEILSKYFPDAVFSKPTGDGLFIIYNYEEETVKDTVNMLIERCIDLEDNFANLLKGNPMITFNTPANIGMGITRGTTCCIHNGEYIIDYSGKILNHAARLMEKARPSGIICDYISFYNILNEDIMNNFEEDAACLRGVSEKEPIQMLIQKDKVIILDIDKRPLNEDEWEVKKWSYTVEYIKSIGKSPFRLSLEKKPLIKDSLYVEITYPCYKDGVDLIMSNYQDYDLSSDLLYYESRGPKSWIMIKFDDVLSMLIEEKVPDDKMVIIEVTYSI